MAEFAWAGADSGVSWGTDLKADAAGTVTVQDGYINLQSAGNVSLSGVGALTGFGYAENGGATAEQVMKAVGGGFMFNNVRAYFGTSTTAMSSVQIQNNGFYMLDAPKYNGQSPKTVAFSTPVTLAMVMSVTDPTLSLSWGATKLNDGTSLGTYADSNGNTKNYTAANKTTAYEVEYIEVDGEMVLATNGTSTSVEPFFRPSMYTAAKVEYDLAGNKLETPLENVKVYLKDEHKTTGFFGFYMVQAIRLTMRAGAKMTPGIVKFPMGYLYIGQAICAALMLLITFEIIIKSAKELFGKKEGGLTE